MNHTNILTVGGGGAGAITAAQLSSDLGGLAMYGLSCIDGACGSAAPAEVVDMASRVVAVVAFGLVTVAGAALGRLVAHFISPQSTTTT
jgi:hypothetical protein